MVTKQHRRSKKRAQVIDMLGGKCANCGQSDVRVLQIDHRHNDGHKLRRGGRIRGFDEKHYGAIIRGEDPIDRYQLLCANCHMLKNNGYLEEKDIGPKRTGVRAIRVSGTVSSLRQRGTTRSG